MNDVNNKMPRNKKITLIVGGVILLGSLAAFAGGKAYRHHGGHGSYMLEHVSDDLKLDNAQRAQLESLGSALIQAKQTLRNGDALTSVLASIQGEALDQSALTALVDNKLNAARQQSPQIISALAGFYDSLNYEQQQQARAKLERIATRIKSHGHDDD